MPKVNRKRHIRPAPWYPIEWIRSGRYVRKVIGPNAMYLLHATKGWRRFSRRAGQ